MVKILAIDPAGDFSPKGKGHTGIVWMLYNENDKNIVDIKHFTIKAIWYNSKKKYYRAILANIAKLTCHFLVIENYQLMTGIGSGETRDLIAIINHYYPAIIKQSNIAIKNIRLSERNLVKKGLLKWQRGRYYINYHSTTQHTRDALKHILVFIYRRYKHSLMEITMANHFKEYENESKEASKKSSSGRQNNHWFTKKRL